MVKQSKRMLRVYKEKILEQVSAIDAIRTLRSYSSVKFDETIEVAIALNMSRQKNKQQIYGTISLPHERGKSVRVAVIACGERLREAMEAGADLVGSEDLIEKIQNGERGFDRCITTPDMMPLVSKLGKILGPKGLMPDPKLGTVSTEIHESVQRIKKGQVEYRAEKTGVIHGGIGKLSSSDEQLAANVSAFITSVLRNPGINTRMVRKVILSSTMGPSIEVRPSDFLLLYRTQKLDNKK